MKLKVVEVAVTLTNNFNSRRVSHTYEVDESDKIDEKELLNAIEKKIAEYLLEKAMGL